MKRIVRLILIALALTCGVSILGGALWYQTDRSGMLGFLCRAGLPNFSRPAAIAADDLGCTIVGPRRRMTGVMYSAFEVSSLLSSDLDTEPAGDRFRSGTWLSCNLERGCGERLDRQLTQNIAGLCDTGLASVTAFGWATETPGQYGHLGGYVRQFFVDEIVEVGPPPAEVVARLRRDRGRPPVESCS